ncbi:carboxyltransferase domain-containing protein [Zhihengliuella sp.]|uniref:5-oxoprolinase subunit B/C family protein n=1 Tax=Zhihengliuella sp. TaxID=1954483 RepID=UPI0028126FC6|nr:carboxyltransferase domain-containing protein [Zhihengliuella sp.]
MRLLTVGTHALLIELDSPEQVLTVHRGVLAEPPDGLEAAIPAAQTVLLRFDLRADVAGERGRLPARVERWLAAGAPTADVVAGAGLGDRPGHGLVDGTIDGTVELDVVYDGEDLAAVAELARLSPEGVVRAHTGRLWRAAFSGFAPGFAYLRPDDAAEDAADRSGHDRLEVPRRSTPRTRVPAGAVALAGGYSAVYPSSSPGGWQLIGRTDAPLWDAERTDDAGAPAPALIAPGTAVRFHAVRELVEVRGSTEDHSAAAPREGATGRQAPAASVDEQAEGRHGLEVLATGMLATLQDGGRRGFEHLGVPTSGYADDRAGTAAHLALASRAERAERAGHRLHCGAVVEAVGAGLTLRARGHHVVAVDSTAEVVISGPYGERAVDSGRPAALYDGETLAIGDGPGQLSYLAVRGGFELPATLGSRSTDLLSGLGPEPLRAGRVLPVRRLDPGVELPPHVPETTGRDRIGEALRPASKTGRPRPVTLRCVLGPRDDWFTAEALGLLTSANFVIGPDSNRTGMRLELPVKTMSLQRTAARRNDELPSEAMVRGALQVPPDGRPILFGPDHPVTGGYPVIAVVVPADTDLAAQLPAGTRVRFEAVPPPQQGDPRDEDFLDDDVPAAGFGNRTEDL